MLRHGDCLCLKNGPFLRPKSNDDPIGSATFFEKIGFNKEPEAVAKIAQETMSSTPIMGAVKRDDGEMKLSLAYGDGPSKKFAAARASFLAWSPSASDSRLVTTARTRDQRASRAFAAEILAPANYLKKRLGKRSDVSPFELDQIAEEIGVASTVVRFQAQNNGYHFSEAA
jgi:hypothetical protein